MPWDETYYPRSMRNLPPEVRLKAVEIANALLEEGYDEGKAIRIAIAKAKGMGKGIGRQLRRTFDRRRLSTTALRVIIDA